MRLITTKAILLRYHDYGESNRLYTFFTRDFGKMTLDAKGARKSKKRQFTMIDLLTHIDVTLRENPKSDINMLYSIADPEPFFNIRNDLKVISAALYFADLVSEYFKDNEKCEPVFDDLLDFLIRFDKGHFTPADIPVFQLKLLERAGYAPELNSCIKCSKPLNKKGMGGLNFYVSKGGVVCELCNTKKVKNPVSLGTVKLLTLAKGARVRDLNRIKFTKSALTESMKILSEFIDYNLGKRLKSYEYLKKMGVA
jgi:DNA repair protein RecO (recombination protein O)